MLFVCSLWFVLCCLLLVVCNKLCVMGGGMFVDRYLFHVVLVIVVCCFGGYCFLFLFVAWCLRYGIVC